MRYDNCTQSDKFQPRVSIPDQLPSHRGPPSLIFHDRLTVVKQILQEGEKDLKDYQSEIDHLQSEILLLQQKKVQLDQYLNHYRSLVAPVWKLPYELLTTIFACLCSDMAALNDNRGAKKNLPQLRLSVVCSHWRSIVRSTPEFWSDISVSFSAEGIPEPDLVQLFLDLSKEKPLTVSMQFSDGGDVLQQQRNIANPACQALAHQAHRWNTVDLVGYASRDLDILRRHVIKSCPELERLRLFGFTDPVDRVALDFVPMPKLTSFDAHSLHPVGSDFFPWHQLDSMSVYGTVDLPRCLPLCENLIFLQLVMVVLPTYSDMLVIHKNLTDLKITLPLPIITDSGIAAGYLEPLTFPSLTSLTVERSFFDLKGVALWPSDPMIPFIQRCSCNLTRLIINDVSIQDHDLIKFLNETPSLTDLEIEEPRLDDDDVKSLPCPLSAHFFQSLCVKDSESSSYALLPHLELLMLIVHKEFDETSFVDMVSSRRGHRQVPESGVASLEEVSLYIGGKDLPLLQGTVDSSKLDPLVYLMAPDFSLLIEIEGDEIVNI